MEENTAAPKPVKEKKQHPVVVIERDWKEYLGECLLIVFSVILALVVTESINTLNEKRKTSEILNQLKEEITDNKKLEEEQYAYHLQVLKNIDSALRNPSIAQQFISNGEINLKLIAPEGVMLHDLNDVAWQIAKENNIISKIDIHTYGLLNNIYNNQQRISNSESRIAEVLLGWESRKPENLKTTLLLLHDNYHGWDVDRAPALIKLYQQAIDKLGEH